MIRFTAVLQEEGKAARALAFESEADSITLGRDNKCEFKIPATTISRQHCRIYFQDQTYIIHDLRSTHGTSVNGKKLEGDEKKVLNNGDVIDLANVRITVSIEVEQQEEVGIGEKTQALAAKAVEEILSGINLGQSHDEGPYLRVLNGIDEGTRFVFGNSNEWYMGRSKDCDFIINDPNISRRHAIIRKDWEGYYVEDLGSKNGVLVNDKKVIKRRFLRHRDEIVIGPIKLLYVDPNFELLNAIDQIEGFESNDNYGYEATEGGEPSEVEAPKDPEADIEPPPGAEGESSIVNGTVPVEGESSEGAAAADPSGEVEDDLPEDLDIDEDLLAPVEEKSSIGMAVIIGGGILFVVLLAILILLFI